MLKSCAKIQKSMRKSFLKPLVAVAAFGIVGSCLGMPAAPAVTTVANAPAPTPAATDAAAPHIQFDSLIYDFGKVGSSELVKHSFTFTNTGKSTLEIIDVRPGCGCTTAGTWDKKVEPGKTGVIPLQFNSAGFGGPVTKQATVTCNDPSSSNLVLQIRGTVWKPIDIQPTMAFFNIPSESETNETRTVRIVSNMDEPVTVSDLQLSNANFRAELKTVKAGKEYELVVTAIPPFTNNGPTMAPITLKTSTTNMPTISITAYAVVQQPVTVTPSQLTLPAGPLTSATTFSIAIHNTGKNPLVLSDAKVNVPRGEVKLQQPNPGRMFTLMLDLPKDFQVKPDQKFEVTVKSNHPKYPLITVPINQPQPAVLNIPTQSAAAVKGAK